jgi:D-alanyl-D-alanine carboxypeptidase/D-alanyl-D-alanine-endopeptidase (penicillin-binding protein 4)
VSAELLTKLLRYAAQNDNIYMHLSQSLPIAGVDGTLRKRMRGSFTNGNVHAKTGTLTGCISLAGYCMASNGHRLCFAIINNGIMHDNNAREFQNRVCTALCEP